MLARQPQTDLNEVASGHGMCYCLLVWQSIPPLRQILCKSLIAEMLR